MTTCCELLIAEHRRTESLLERLESLLEEATAAEPGQSDAWQSVWQAYEAVTQDLRRHFALEEQALFSVLNPYRSMILMEVEHDDLLALQTAFSEQLEQVRKQAGDTEELMHRFQSFKVRLQGHILEEERGIFPLAEERLEPEEKLKVVRLLTEGLEKSDAPLFLVRPQPEYSILKSQIFKPFSKPMHFQTLYEREHTSLQHICIKAGQKQSMHWAGQHQCLLLLEGEVALETVESIQSLVPGDVVTVDSRLLFSLSALSDAQLLAFKAWPHPHYTKG